MSLNIPYKAKPEWTVRKRRDSSMEIGWGFVGSKSTLANLGIRGTTYIGGYCCIPESHLPNTSIIATSVITSLIQSLETKSMSTTWHHPSLLVYHYFIVAVD